MPELPDIELYLHALAPRVTGGTLERVRVRSPSLLRTFDPPLSDAEGRVVMEVTRLGKRVVWRMDNDVFLVIHLMIAGRFKWRPRGAAVPARVGLAAFDFAGGTLLLTEAGTTRRASLHLVRGRAAADTLGRGGLDVLSSTAASFGTAITSENHTLKRALTDPRLLDGIGNAYSDEILHAARLSPFQLTSRLSAEEIARLHASAVETLRTWRDRLIQETGDTFPEHVTAFRTGMAVHGRFGKPCPVCGTPVQRIRYAKNEANYCPACQTGGRLLADRALSRLLRDDWPRSLEDLEDYRNLRRTPPGSRVANS